MQGSCGDVVAWNLLKIGEKRHLVRFLFGLISPAVKALLSEIFQKYQDLDSISTSKTSKAFREFKIQNG